MESNSQAFSLIELLVVVLIIGILAAVATPQYQVAVAKSRVSTILAIAKAVAEAQEVYYLSNGEYAHSITALDITLPAACTQLEREGEEMFRCNNYFLLDNSVNSTDASIRTNYCPNNNATWESCRDNRDFLIVYFLQHYPGESSYSSTRRCFWANNSKLGKTICTNFAGFN
ncbi:prepilin-type N-terminal cleavage/methylation domain-containing protein [bacterium]|nr:prepilin-type N-terminal cleavage/methylation domain-containing protein [bacterium]MBR2081550.1 prepilin-type N-terminal cleavage/methylation domain-containing protein [Elusimicrobiaceae bacterium]